VQVPTREQIATWRQGFVEGTLPSARTGLKYDTEAQGWVEQWAAGRDRLAALGADMVERGAGEIAALERQLVQLEGVLELDAVKNDDYERNLKLDQKRALTSDLQIKLLERERLESRQEKLDRLYTDRRNRYIREADSRIDAHLEGLQGPARVQAYAAQYEATWGPAYARVGQAKGIATASIPDFTRYAQMVGSLEVDRTGAAIPDERMETFLAATADEYLAMVDRHHRAQAADYARTAAERAAQPAPLAVPAGPGGPPAIPAADPNPLNAVYAEARRNLAINRAS